MITDIKIKNFKSIVEISLPLSRVNVLIGENGAGKSNILEAIALGSAASANKLDNEFLASRGIRVTQSEFMRPAFTETCYSDSVSVSFSDSKDEVSEFLLSHDNEPYSKWNIKIIDNNTLSTDIHGLIQTLEEFQNYALDNLQLDEAKKVIDNFLKSFRKDLNKKQKTEKAEKQTKIALTNVRAGTITYELDEKNNLNKDFISIFRKKSYLYKTLENFLIYSPEHTSLRSFQKEGQIEPLGINGEGLLKLISVISEDSDKSDINEIKSSLKLLGWFEDFKLTDEAILSTKGIEVRDHYIANDRKYLDHMSTNEGFLFLLFYFAAITSKLTPKFFAIDNIDASLNPKLCEELIRKLVLLAKKHDKQIILTTHNPATLDGLNLDDEEQRLFVVTRGRLGETKIKRIKKRVSKEGTPPVRLSEMFIKGILGGLPKGF